MRDHKSIQLLLLVKEHQLHRLVLVAEANRREDDDLAAANGDVDQGNTEEENNQAVLNRGFSAIDDNKFIGFMKNFRRKKAVEED